MMIVYSMTLCFMPKTSCCIFQAQDWMCAGLGKVRSFGIFGGIFKASLPRHSVALCSLVLLDLLGFFFWSW